MMEEGRTFALQRAAEAAARLNLPSVQKLLLGGGIAAVGDWNAPLEALKQSFVWCDPRVLEAVLASYREQTLRPRTEKKWNRLRPWYTLLRFTDDAHPRSVEHFLDTIISDGVEDSAARATFLGSLYWEAVKREAQGASPQDAIRTHRRAILQRARDAGSSLPVPAHSTVMVQLVCRPALLKTLIEEEGYTPKPGLLECAVRNRSIGGLEVLVREGGLLPWTGDGAAAVRVAASMKSTQTLEWLLRLAERSGATFPDDLIERVLFRAAADGRESTLCVLERHLPEEQMRRAASRAFRRAATANAPRAAELLWVFGRVPLPIPTRWWVRATAETDAFLSGLQYDMMRRQWFPALLRLFVAENGTHPYCPLVEGLLSPRRLQRLFRMDTPSGRGRAIEWWLRWRGTAALQAHTPPRPLWAQMVASLRRLEEDIGEAGVTQRLPPPLVVLTLSYLTARHCHCYRH